MIPLNARAAALAAVVVLAPAVTGCGVNAIPTKQETAEARWADVQSQYQRRSDLIPNLVATVQGAAIAERTTLTQVIEARSRATGVTVTPETLNDPAAFQRYQAAQGELTRRIKASIGVTVAVEVVDVASIERSVGKMRRIVDHRQAR